MINTSTNPPDGLIRLCMLCRGQPTPPLACAGCPVGERLRGLSRAEAVSQVVDNCAVDDRVMIHRADGMEHTQSAVCRCGPLIFERVG